jgi:glycopeptide antibiotics resistance protein
MTTTTLPAAATRTRPLLAGLFGLYLVLLAWVVLWKFEVPWVGEPAMRVVKLVPFVATSDAGASDPVEVALNFLLFVPFGLYVSLLAPTWRWWRAAMVVAGGSLALETAQFVLAVGSFDVTDLAVNTAGGLAGFGLAVLARSRLGARTVTRICVIGTVLAVVACALVVASPLRFAAPPGDLPMGPAVTVR